MEGQPARKKLRPQVEVFNLDIESPAQVTPKQEVPSEQQSNVSQAKLDGERKKLGLSNTSTSFTVPPSGPAQISNLHPALQQGQGYSQHHSGFMMNGMMMNSFMGMNPMYMQQYQMMSAQQMPMQNEQPQFHFSEEEFQENPELVLQQIGLTKEDFMQQIQQEEEDQEFNEMIEDIELFNKDEFDAKFKDCTCCKGYIYNCKSKVCENLGVCQCKAHSEMEEDANERFIPECQNCSCCKGFVYTCIGERCKDRPVCFCFADDD